MKKQELARLVHEYGDAIITYRSEHSKKLKYNVCTLDFYYSLYSEERRTEQKKRDNTMLFFCWDTDSYRLLASFSNVSSVVPLSSILKNDRTYYDGSYIRLQKPTLSVIHYDEVKEVQIRLTINTFRGIEYLHLRKVLYGL